MEKLPNSVIEISHLNKSFGENVVLNDFNLHLKKGENLVVLGKSGSGKSVLIKCIIGLIPYDHGMISVLGKDIKDLNQDELDKLRTKVGFLFQSSALFDSMTVKENIQFVMKRRFPGKHKQEVEMETLEVLENVGLRNALNLMPSELSGGMKKRIGLARALAMKPEVMLYDEPTTGLDPITSREISKLIIQIQNKYNTSSIIITHDLNCAKITGNRVLLLSNGIAYKDGSFKEMESSMDTTIHNFFE